MVTPNDLDQAIESLGASALCIRAERDAALKRLATMQALLVDVREAVDDAIDGAPDAGQTAQLANSIATMIDAEPEYGFAQEAVAKRARLLVAARIALQSVVDYYAGNIGTPSFLPNARAVLAQLKTWAPDGIIPAEARHAG